MSDGIGCKCSARDQSECACGVDWTPKEVYELRAERDALKVTLTDLLEEIGRTGFCTKTISRAQELLRVKNKKEGI